MLLSKFTPARTAADRLFLLLIERLSFRFRNCVEPIKDTAAVS